MERRLKLSRFLYSCKRTPFYWDGILIKEDILLLQLLFQSSWYVFSRSIHDDLLTLELQTDKPLPMHM